MELTSLIAVAGYFPGINVYLSFVSRYTSLDVQSPCPCGASELQAFARCSSAGLGYAWGRPHDSEFRRRCDGGTDNVRNGIPLLS